MHISAPITILALTPSAFAYSAHYARGYDDGQLEILARRAELLRRIDTRAKLSQAVAKIGATGKDGSAVFKVFNKTPEGRNIVKPKLAGVVGAVAGGIEGALFPKKGSAPVTANPGLNAQDKANGKNLKQYEAVGVKAAEQTTLHSIGNTGEKDKELAQKIGKVEGAVAYGAGHCYDNACDWVNKVAGTHLRRDLEEDELELYARDLFAFDDEEFDGLAERDLVDEEFEVLGERDLVDEDDLDIWY